MLSLPWRLAGSRRARVLADRLTRGAENGRREPTGLPGSWGTPRCPRRLLKAPAGPPPQAGTGGPARPPPARTAGAPTTGPISGLDGPARTHAVYASPGWAAHQDARLASGCWPGSTGWARGPLGSSERFRAVSDTSPPSPGLPWRKRAAVRHPAGDQTEAR